MDNPPDRIYLQHCTDGEMTWCVDQIHDDDTEYLKATPEREGAPEAVEALAELRAWLIDLRIPGFVGLPTALDMKIVKALAKAWVNEI